MIGSCPDGKRSAAAAPVVEHIKAEHRALARLIGAMQALVARWRAPGKKPHLALLDALLDELERAPDRLHQATDNRGLFAAVAGRGGQARELIRQLTRERARGEQMIAATRAALGRASLAGAPALEGLATAVEELAELYWWRLHREEEQLLPLARGMLSAAEWRAIAAALDSHAESFESLMTEEY